MSLENEAGSPAPAESEAVKSTEQNTPNATAADGNVEQKQAEPAKTFTQEEVDALVQKRLQKEERRIAKRFEQAQREQVQAQTIAQVPKRDSFSSDDEFAQAQIEHLSEKKALEKIKEREVARQSEERTEAFLAKAEKAQERYPDFQTVVSNPSLQINTEMAEYIADSELGADVAYYLGTNPLKAAQIAQMSPMKAARELLSIETELANKPKPRTTKAPEPINPVGNRGNSSSSNLPSDEDDVRTWMEKERKRVSGR